MNLRWPRLQPDWTEQISKWSLLSLFLSLFFLLLFSGCGRSDTHYVRSPQIDFECTFAEATACTDANVGKTVFVGLTTDLTTTCLGRLAGVSGAALHAQFDYSAEIKAESAMTGVLSGAATRWVNRLQMPVVQLPKDTFKVCAFIDVDDNERLDDGEPIQDSSLTIGLDFLPLSNWSNY